MCNWPKRSTKLWLLRAQAAACRVSAANNRSGRRIAMGVDGALSGADIELLQKEFGADPAYRRSQNAVTQVTIDDVALDRRIVTGIDPSMSHLLDDWRVTNQKQSGRCWMFAGLNLLRVGAMKAMNLKDFEFSQNYTMFWDKLERANYFLESIITTLDR